MGLGGGRAVRNYFALIESWLKANADSEHAAAVAAALKQLQQATMWIASEGMKDPEQAGAAATPYLRLFALTSLAWMWARMAAVANDVTGTAYRASQLGLGDIQMAGKTGTAQSRDYGTGSRGPRDAVWTRRDHALFVAFAPHDAPRYAIALIIQHAPAGGSADAAPRAREIMKTVLLKDPDMRARIERPAPPEAVTGEADEGEAGALPGGEVTGQAAAEVLTPSPSAPARAPRTATSGPRPYLSEPR